MRATHRVEPEGAAEFDGAGDVILLQAGAGWRQDGDARARSKSRWLCHNF